MSYVIELNASDPAPPAGAQNVHFRKDAAHLGTESDPIPTSAFIDAFAGDSGSGGASGLVPAPAAGDAAAGKFLHADGSFELPPLPVVFILNDGSSGSGVGPLLIAPRAGKVTKCILAVKSSDASTALTFAIKQNGTDVFSSDPTSAAGTAAGTVTTFTTLTSSPLAIAEGDVFTIDISSGSSDWSFTALLV